MKYRFLLLLLPFSACAYLNPPAANDIYVLKAAASVVDGDTLPVSVSVVQPEAAPGLDTARIAVAESPNRLTYYTGVAWAKPLPPTLQLFLTDALRQSQAFKAVSSDKDGVFADINLLTEIRDFEVEEGAKVHVRLVATLVNTGNHKIIGSFTTEKTIAAAANHMPDIVAAFNEAMDKAVVEILANIRMQEAAHLH